MATIIRTRPDCGFGGVPDGRLMHWDCERNAAAAEAVTPAGNCCSVHAALFAHLISPCVRHLQ